MSSPRRGLVALGDSITNGHGEPMLGVHPQSWAQWLAEALELPCTKLARDGALTADVLADQVPRLQGTYDLGCVYAGVNDARGPAWDTDRFARELNAILAALSATCERVLVCTIPEDLGRPTAAPKPREANAVIRAAAAVNGARVVALDDLGGPALVLPDAVHPTALGQAAIASRALAASGLQPRRPLDELVDADHRRRARGRWRRRRMRLSLQDSRRRALERLRGR